MPTARAHPCPAGISSSWMLPPCHRLSVNDKGSVLLAPGRVKPRPPCFPATLDKAKRPRLREGVCLLNRARSGYSGHGDRAAVGTRGAFDGRRREDVHELVLAIGDQPREVEVLVIVDAVLGDQLAMHREGQILVGIGHDL